MNLSICIHRSTLQLEVWWHFPEALRCWRIHQLFLLKPFRKSVRAARRSILCMFSHIDALAHTRAICTCCFFGKVISRTSCLVTTWEDLLLTLHDASCTLCTPNSLVSRLISSRFAHTSPFSTYFHKHISNCFEILFEILKVHCAAPNL